MTDLLRLATELERSGGVHRFIGLVQAASLVLLRFEHGESVTVRGERWPLPVGAARPCWTDVPHFSQRGADCQGEEPDNV